MMKNVLKNIYVTVCDKRDLVCEKLFLSFVGTIGYGRTMEVSIEGSSRKNRKCWIQYMVAKIKLAGEMYPARIMLK